MSNEVTPYDPNQFGVVPADVDRKAMSRALRGIKQEASAGGQMYLKMDKTGTWVFGSDQEPVPPGTLFAVDPNSFMHGYIAWGTNMQKLGEALIPATTPLPAPPPAPAGSRGWEKQFGMTVRHVNVNGGDDLGVMLIRSNSWGGRKAIGAISDEVGRRWDTDEPLMVVVSLASSSYVHKKYGKLYEPVFEIAGWVESFGEAQQLAGGEEEEKPAPKKAVKAKARKVAK